MAARPTTEPAYELLIQSGPRAGEVLPLVLPVTLGHQPQADVEIADPTVAPRHARLTLLASGPVLYDLQAPGGSYVNSARVVALTSLHDGDEVQLGDTRLLFRARAAAMGTAPMPDAAPRPSAWRAPWTAAPDEPPIGRATRLLTTAGAVALLLWGVLPLLGIALVEANDSFVVLAQLVAGIIAAHGYVALRLRRGALGPYRTALALGALWIAPAITAPIALVALGLLLRPRAARYYREPLPLPAAAETEPATGSPPPLPANGTPEAAASLAIAALGQGPFALLSAEWRQRLLDAARHERYARGAVVLREGDASRDLYYVLEGQLAVEGSALGGQVLPLAEVGSGEYFGEMALLTGAPRTATVRAESEARLLVLPAALLREALAAQPLFAAALRQRVDYLDVASFVQRFSPFATLPAAAAAALARRFRRGAVPAGATLVRAGEPAATWYLVKRGAAEAIWPDGRRLRLGPGDGFGEEALLRGTPAAYRVVALTELEVLGLDRADFAGVVRAFPAVQRFFSELLRARYAGAPDQPLGLPDPVSTLMPGLSRPARRTVWWLFLDGVALLAVFTALALRTQSGAAIAGAVLVGSLLPAVVYLRYLEQRDLLRTLSWRRLLGISAAGILLGIPAAMVFEEVLVGGAGSLGPALVVGLCEEAAKLLGVIWLLWRRRYRFELDGIVFGVAAGMAFAAPEDALYAISSFDPGGTGGLLFTVWLRMLTTFVGHPVWTGLVCAAIWRGKRGGTPQWDWEVVGTFTLAVVLHALWDWSTAFVLPVAIFGTLLLRQRIQRASEAEYQALESLALTRPASAAPSDRRPARCPNCGADAAPGTLYCVQCGAALASAALPG
ncbi:MAG TPA: cyclic nucleotide-binding domain-containing protein [Chloroflexota bacterium]